MLYFPDMDPVALQIGSWGIRWYGVCYLAGILIGYRLLLGRRHTIGWSSEELLDLSFLYVPLGAIVGGRLGSIIVYYPLEFFADPLVVLRIWEGGMSFHGGLAGVIVATILFARSRKRGFWESCDALAAAAPQALGLGRIGNFINGELWGTPSGLPWAMVFPHVDRLSRHPSQLYQALLEGGLLFAAVWWYSARPRPAAATAAVFLAGYGILRFLAEFTRAPDAHIGYLAWDWLTAGQALCIPMIVAGPALWFWAQRWAPGPARPSASPTGR